MMSRLLNLLRQNWKLSKSFIFFSGFLLCFLPFTNRLIDNHLTPKFFVFNLWLLGLFIYTAIILIRKSQIQIPKILFILSITYIAYILLSSVSLFPIENGLGGILNWIYIFGFVILMFCIWFIRFENPNIFLHFSWLITAIVCIVLIISLFTIIPLLISGNYNHETSYLITSVFGHRNRTSQYLLLYLPFLAYLTTKYHGKIKYILISIIGLIVILIAMLLVRSTWLALVITTLFVGIIYTLKNKTKNKKLLLVLFGVIITVSIVYKSLPDKHFVKSHLNNIVKTEWGSSQDRLILWKKTIDISKESVYWGNGLDNWRIEILKTGYDNLNSKDYLTFYQRPHNDFLWILNQQGIFALLAYIIFWFLIIRYLISSYFKSTCKDNKTFQLSSIFSIVAYLIIAFFSFPMERLEPQLIVFSLIALNLKSSTNNYTLKIKPHFVIPTSLIILIVIGFGVFLNAYFIKSEIHLKTALYHKQFYNNKSTIRELEKVNSNIYTYDSFSTPIEWYKGNAYAKMNNLEKAEIALNKAYSANPYHIYTLNDLGILHSINENYDQAKVYYNKALMLAPGFNETIYNMAHCYLKQNITDSALIFLNTIYNPDNISQYHLYIRKIAPMVLYNYAMKIKEPLIAKQFFGMADNVDWALSVYLKSRKNAISFYNQAVLDALFVLVEDKKIGQHQADQLKEIYFKTNFLRIYKFLQM